MERLVYSPKKHLPLFKLVWDEGDSSGVRFVEYLNTRTGKTELNEATSLVIYLLEAEMNRNNQGTVIHSPIRAIPLGKVRQNKHGIFFLEIKHKDDTECIRFSTYVSLMLKAG